jgi:hypothetical protein
MGNKHPTSEKKQSKSDVVLDKKSPKFFSGKPDQMMEQFNSLISKKKAAFYSANIKAKDFTQIMTQVKVSKS